MYRWFDEKPDTLIISTFGAPINEWVAAKKHFDVMEKFEQDTLQLNEVKK